MFLADVINLPSHCSLFTVHCSPLAARRSPLADHRSPLTAHRSPLTARVKPPPHLQTDVILLANNSQHCWIVQVASVCIPCCLLSRVVESCCTKFETGKTFSYVQTGATLLANNVRSCWPTTLRPSAQGVMRITPHYLLQSSQQGYLC